MNVEITNSSVTSFVKANKDSIPQRKENEFYDGDVVIYENSYYILKESSSSTKEKPAFDLYTLKGELYLQNVDIKKLAYVMPKEKFNQLAEKLSSTSSCGSSGCGGGSTGGGTSGGTTSTRTGRDYSTSEDTDVRGQVKSKDGTDKVSSSLGQREETEKALAASQAMISKAQEAINTANLTINSWQDVNNAQGYATDASIVFLNNLTNALDTLQNNLDKTDGACLEVNELNYNVKDLLVKYTEKKEKEDELKPKEESLEKMSPTKEVTETDGSKKEVENEEYTKLQKEIDELKKEIEEIDKKIVELQNEVDARLKKIEENYSGLLNFNNSNVQVSSGNIFGTSGNLNGKSIEVSNDVILDYMVTNNLEYFNYDNSIYNVPCPYDPWNNMKLVLDEKYLLRYDLDKLSQYANAGNQVAASAISFLQGKASGKIPASVRFMIDSSDSGLVFYNNGGYSSLSDSYKSQIPQVVDTILADSYESNGCESVSDYAATAMMVMSGGIFNTMYGGSAKPTMKGVSGILNDADCISAVNWAMSQGIINAEGRNGLRALGLGYELRGMSGGYDGSSLCEVGTILTKPSGSNNWHTGMVVGHTTVNGVKQNVIVHIGNSKYGFNAHIPNGYDTAITAENVKRAYYA